MKLFLRLELFCLRRSMQLMKVHDLPFELTQRFLKLFGLAKF